ncbi:biotin/lipoyl-binding protein [Mucilaginibacter sp. RS28]|uniref:Biotin/lipoyl-binding protein n=1 Tax=Mucilaginibacter straminoryzae TaxID=2932774 RepID=A0A9X1X9A2_9SPHI|nr:acetyl-CoA carboxylase biotin carboxyl carrier protein subunit [Mucilaginibacter straminoryzae]MCJ8210754.1 biotin/lipoyl-binding protein [Mucilaginibacter straminoryzae]
MYQITVNEKFKFTTEGKDGLVELNDSIIQPDIASLSQTRFHIILDDKSYQAELVAFDATEKSASIKVNGNVYELKAKDQYDALLEQLGMSSITAGAVADLKAPMPGLVLKVFVNEGDTVQKGDNLFVLEAMKMENIIKAPASATVKSVRIKPGDKVEKGTVLIGF